MMDGVTTNLLFCIFYLFSLNARNVARFMQIILCIQDGGVTQARSPYNILRNRKGISSKLKRISRNAEFKSSIALVTLWN